MKQYVDIPQNIKKFLLDNIDEVFDIWGYKRVGHTHTIYLDYFAPYDRHLLEVKVREVLDGPAKYGHRVLQLTSRKRVS